MSWNCNFTLLSSPKHSLTEVKIMIIAIYWVLLWQISGCVFEKNYSIKSHYKSCILSLPKGLGLRDMQIFFDECNATLYLEDRSWACDGGRDQDPPFSVWSGCYSEKLWSLGKFTGRSRKNRIPHRQLHQVNRGQGTGDTCCCQNIWLWSLSLTVYVLMRLT